MSVSDESVLTRLTVLEHDMVRANTTLEKIQNESVKHRELHVEKTEKIYQRMEDLRTELKEEIKTLKTELETQIEKQNIMLEAITAKLNGLDKWRWIVVGFSTAAGFFLSKFTDFLGIFVK